MPSLFSKLYSWPPKEALYLIMATAGLISISAYLIMAPVEDELKRTTPYGVLDIEFMWTDAMAMEIMATWGPQLIEKELSATNVDFAFMLGYGTLLSGISLLLARGLREKGLVSQANESQVIVLALLPYAAMLFDAIENINIIVVLAGPSNPNAFNAMLASISATLKFSLLLLSVLFTCFLLLMTLSGKRARAQGGSNIQPDRPKRNQQRVRNQVPA